MIMVPLIPMFLIFVLIKEIQKRKIKPTAFLPLWDLLGVALGFGTTMIDEKAAMLCTASVEEVIDGHYKKQLDKLTINPIKPNQILQKILQLEL